MSQHETGAERGHVPPVGDAGSKPHIETGIPRPVGWGVSEAIRRLEVGESILTTASKFGVLQRLARQEDKQFSYRKQQSGYYRVWRIR